MDRQTDRQSPSTDNPNLIPARVDDTNTSLTTDQGVVVGDTDNSLLAGLRGPTLLEDFHLREKLMRFDHERIPERVVYARGAGAHGYFQVYESLERYTCAAFLSDPLARTPVFVRFSTAQGSRGSADTVRDVRGFAVKFYTEEGNFDLVGNNMPVFFIQDGIKFPDLVHALKPEPDSEIPQATSAHDTFWDFVTLQPETMHHVMWLMSDRALPASYRTMQGFGVHTFRLINQDGRCTFVKFHWSPTAGVASLVWDEAAHIAGFDPDFNRRDLWESIEAGIYPEYELGIQMIPAAHEYDFDIDLLDPTKILPEEAVPVIPVGRMVLDRNPDNFFAETEQIAFCVGNVVPGIGFTNDPLLQARLFSYPDTALTRLGGPNFAQIPINKPITAVHNHQQDGLHQDAVHQGRANYHPNTLDGGCPAIGDGRPYMDVPARVDGVKERRRSATFADHYSQPRLFWNSMSAWEKQHIVEAYRFELGKVRHVEIRERMIEHLNMIDHHLARAVGAGLGIDVPTATVANPGHRSPALSQAKPYAPASAMAHAFTPGIVGKKVAILAADGVRRWGLTQLEETLSQHGAVPEIVAITSGRLRASDGEQVVVSKALRTVWSVLYDAVVVADGELGVPDLIIDEAAIRFVTQAYVHAKPVAAMGSGVSLLQVAGLGDELAAEDGVIVAAAPDFEPDQFAEAVVSALRRGRFYDRALTTAPA